MLTKLRNSYHNASQWAHHHSAVLVFGLTVLAATFGWQFGSQFIDSETHASYDPIVWTARCDANESNYVIDLTECYALANIYAQLDGPDWNINLWPPHVAWFSSTDIANWHGITLLNNHVDRFQLTTESTFWLGEVIDFSWLPYLNAISLLSTAISWVDVSQNSLLTSLHLRQHSNMTSLDVSQNTELQTLDIEGNNITSIDLSTLSDLEILALSYNDITSVDLSANPLLKQFTMFGWARYGNIMTGIDLSNNPNLEYIGMYSQGLETIDLSNKPLLKNININNNNLQGSLDLSSSPLLNLVSVARNDIDNVLFAAWTTGL